MDENENTQANQNFLNRLNSFNSNEEKIKMSLEEMKKALSQDGKPDFKKFWEIKNVCLSFFKEPLNSSLRIEFWKNYIDLSNEVKKLKNLLYEKTTFEVEQIDLAISAIEEEINKYDEVLQSIEEIEIKEKLKIFLPKKEFFLKTQKELTLLNAFAARISSLRKEVIKTQMRSSCKNKFLKRLTILGDIVFPKRKKFINSISEEFSNAVDIFVKDIFDLRKTPFFVLREKIKDLQDIAKKFTLNTYSFTNCRLKLSRCWDQVKIAEKNYKREKVQFKNIIDQVLEKIKVLKNICENNPEDESIEKEEKEIYNFMKTLNLRKEDIKFLRYKIKEAKATIYQKKQIEKEEKIKKDNEKENERKEKLDNVKRVIDNLLENSQLTLEELEQEKNQIEKDLEIINPVKFEKLILEKPLRSLMHLIEDKKEKVELVSSDEVKYVLKIFEQKKQRRQNIKNHLDSLNKELACSGVDFEKAMLYRDLIDSEKQRLEDIDKAIEKLEEKLVDLESN